MISSIKYKLPELTRFLKSKLQDLLIFREADLQVWTYIWFIDLFGSTINKEYFVFNQPRFKEDLLIPDIVVLHHSSPLLAMELKDAVNSGVTIDRILNDTKKCVHYIESGYGLAIQLVIHDLNPTLRDEVLKSISDIVKNNLQEIDQYHIIWISPREFSDYDRWKEKVKIISDMFKQKMIT